jgi:hypothetical protein
MAIWPFGRKGKRPRSQMKASDKSEKVLSSQSPDHSPVPQGLVTRKPSRKRSKREKNRPRRSPSAEFSLPRPAAASLTTEPLSSQNHVAQLTATGENPVSLSSIGQEHFAVVQYPMLQRRRSGSERRTLKKRLSKRSAKELAREQEIRAMSSSPMSHYPGSTASTREYYTWDVRRGPSAQSRRTEHHASDHSLPIRDSAQSSISEGSDSYTFKVNALAVFAPRPVIRYSEPKYYSPRSLNPSANSTRKDKRPLLDEEDVHSKRRIAELADDLDAPALRELLERDRRRKEKKRLEDQERLQRRLQRRAERQQEEERRQAGQKQDIDYEDLRGRDRTDSSTISTAAQAQPELSRDRQPASTGQSGSWLRGPSRDSDLQSHRLSELSAHVIGNIDDRSIRAGRSGPRLRPSHSSMSQDRASTSASHVLGVAVESSSDLSRAGDSERRLSDNSGKRMASWTTFFRRGKRDSSSRRPPSQFSNASGESFSKTQPQSHPPAVVPPAIPERSFLRTGIINRPQSKFTEHLGDYPISPPDSRIQSPMPVLETVPDMSPHPERSSGGLDEELAAASHPSPIDTESGHGDQGPSRPLSWEATSSRGTGPEGAFLSQSLASIDSEGSWMSGKYLRGLPQAANPGRGSAGSQNRTEDYEADEYSSPVADEPQEVRDSVAGLRRASSIPMGAEMRDDSDECPTPVSPEKEADETWHAGVARRPTLVRPRQRPKSKSGLLNDVEMLDASPDSDVSPVEEDVEIRRATSIDLGRGHARKISAGSARLLDIRRTSTESRRSADQVSEERS